MSGIWRATRMFVYRRVLHADDTPHRIALGVGIATLVGFTPLMGVQTIIALSIAAVCRANKAVCLPFVWVTNPVTFVPIYWFCWRLGMGMIPGGRAGDEMAVIAKLNALSGEGAGFFTQVFSLDFWKGMVGLMFELGSELWLGCTAVGLVCGGLLYLVTLRVVLAYRSRRRLRMTRRPMTSPSGIAQ